MVKIGQILSHIEQLKQYEQYIQEQHTYTTKMSKAVKLLLERIILQIVYSSTHHFSLHLPRFVQVI